MSRTSFRANPHFIVRVQLQSLMASLLQNGQALLQSRAALRYYKVGQEMLQGGANVTKNWGRFYKVESGGGGGRGGEESYHKVRQITYYKVGQSLLQIGPCIKK